MPARLRSSCVLRAVALALFSAVWPAIPKAATVPGMYDATVPLTERSERGQTQALQDAMRQVLVRITGRRDAGEDPGLAPIVNDARRYVQQFRVVGANQFLAGFDGARVERAVIDAGQPLWGHERPATLVLLVAGEGNARALVTQESVSDLKTGVARAAQLRGLPLLWPAGSQDPGAGELQNASATELATLAQRFNADAVLVGNPAGPALLRWTLVQGTDSTQWRGSAEEGPQGAADWFARVFAGDAADEGAIVAITVAGIADLRAYAAVTDYLQSLTLVRALSVEQIAGDNVVYRARVQGGSERLARAIGLGGRLESQGAANVEAGALSYRYRQ